MTFIDYCDLCETIKYHMKRYYDDDEPEISDYEYDMLMQQCKNIEKEHPDWQLDDSPTKIVGASADGKIKHDIPMLSIEDVFTKDDVVNWVNKVHTKYPNATFSVEQKIDGVSMTARYNDKTFSSSPLHGCVLTDDFKLRMFLNLAESRGDGFTGENVTNNAMVIKDIPKIVELPYEELQVRGEVYMSHDDFDRYNTEQEKAGKKLAANPRNLAAGTLRLLNSEEVKNRGLKVFFFNIQKGNIDLMEDHIKGLETLADAGFPVVWHKKCSTSEEVLNAIDEIAEMRSTLDYDIDGAVVKINEVAYRRDFSTSSKYSSGHIAYKYPPEEKNVVMDNIIVDIGRTGKLTFTAEFHDAITGGPCKLCGTNVSRATLHNIDYINDMKIGIGGTYKLFKSGEIIPKLNGCVKEPEAVFEAPTKCPACNSTLEKEGTDFRCSNPLCISQLARTLTYFADCMNIKGFGEAMVDGLIYNGLISDYTYIYRLNEVKDIMVNADFIPGKEKTINKLLAEIEKSKSQDAANLLTAFGIRNVGKSTAKSLLKQYKSLKDLSNATVEDLQDIEDVGPITAKYVVEFFDTHPTLIDSFIDLGVNTVSSETASAKLAGKTIVVTGTLPTLGRKEITDLIESNGGKCSGSVSKKTSFVIAGEAAGTKLTKAKELGVKVITEEEFKEMLKTFD